MILDQWGVDPKTVVRAEKFADAAKPSLFSNDVSTRLYLQSTEDIKKITTVFTESDGDYDFVHSGFVMIAVGANRNSTKKLEAMVSKSGGTVIASKSKDGVSTVETMLSELHLSREVEQFLSGHVGSSVEKLIPIHRTVSRLSPKQQSRISVEDMVIRISPNAGEIPPWELEKPLFDRKATETVESARRILTNSHPILVLSVLKNSLTRLHRIRMMLASGVSDENTIMQAAGNMSKSQASFLIRRAKGLSLDQTAKMAEIIADYEDKMKGKEPTDPYVSMEIMLMKLLATLKRGERR